MQTFRLCFFVTIVFSSSFCYGQTSLRKKINIDDNWKFHFGNAADPAKDFNYGIATIFFQIRAAHPEQPLMHGLMTAHGEH